MNAVEQPPRAAYRQAIFVLAAFLLLLAAAMLLPAGMDWTNGWVFLLVFLLETGLAVPYLWRKNPEIFVARRKIHAGTKGWDKVIIFFLILLFVATFVLPGLDNRYHWSTVPLWATGVGYALFTIGMLGSI